MKRAVAAAYTFTPGSSQIALTGISGFSIRRLFAILNQTTGAILYAAGTAGLGYSALSGATLTLQAPMTGMASGDDLLILYDDGAVGAPGDAAWSGSGDSSVVAALKAVAKSVAAPLRATGFNAVASASVTRPADTTGYSFGDLVANSTTAGSVAALALSVARADAGAGRITAARLRKSGVSLVAASFRAHFYGADPALSSGISNGDNGAWLTKAAGYLGYADLVIDKTFSDGAGGSGVPRDSAANPREIVFSAGAGSRLVWALIEARAAYTPVSGETFTLDVDLQQD